MDESVMMMKNEQLLSGYNIQIGTENQFLINFSTHNNAGDSGLFRANMNKFHYLTGVVPDSVIGDSAYGSEENYQFCEDNQIEAYLKKMTDLRPDKCKRNRIKRRPINKEYEVF